MEEGPRVCMCSLGCDLWGNRDTILVNEIDRKYRERLPDLQKSLHVHISQQIPHGCLFKTNIVQRKELQEKKEES